MQRVVTLKTEPIVGRRYLVPCVPMQSRVPVGRRFLWIPVFGTLHEDTEVIRFHRVHWHYDLCFISDDIFRKTGGSPPITSNDLKGILVGYDNAAVVEKIRVCRRQMPNYPLVSFRAALDAAYADARVVTAAGCRLCPHRGLPLDGLPPEPNGAVTCRGHGLRWGADGKLAPRKNGEPS